MGLNYGRDNGRDNKNFGAKVSLRGRYIPVGVKRSLLLRGLISALVVSALAGCTSEGGSSAGFDRERSTFTPESIRSYFASPLYWLGTRFERWELSAILGPAQPDGTISFIYGACTPSDGEQPSCAPPIELQVTPLCRHLENVAKNPIWRRRHIRSAPVGTIDNAPVLFSNSAQVQVYTADSDLGLALRALRALRSANHMEPVISADEPIPAAPVAVLAGTRTCS